MTKIHPSAQVHPRALIGEDVVIGPCSVIDENVCIGPGTRIDSHCVVTGCTELGARNHLHPFASVGTPPQDHTYRGEPTRLVIGDDNEIREFVTLNCGTVKGGGVTIIGNHNLFMACSHVGHDCVVGDHVTLSNCALLAGHVRVENGVIMSGHTAVHQFVTLGAICMLAGLAGITRDVPPFMIMMPEEHQPRAVNAIGMKRNGYTDEDVRSVQHAFRVIYGSKLAASEGIQKLREEKAVTPPVAAVIESIERAARGRLGRFLEIVRQDAGGEA